MHDYVNLRKQLHGISEFPPSVIQHIHNQRWLHLWVPKQYGGLGLAFGEGLKILRNLALTDGSLGWMVTLCAGANYFSRNLRPEVAKDFFRNPETCFGGSGMIGGTAEIQKNSYIVNGIWKFATGAPHLSHFTLNAVLTQNGKPVTDENGNEQIRSFIVPKEMATIIPDWKSMGMRATGTYSFEVNNVVIEAAHSFVYNTFFTDHLLDRIPFRIFADLTLLVNYVGIAMHFAEEAVKIRTQLDISAFLKYLETTEKHIYSHAEKTEHHLVKNEDITEAYTNEVHAFGENAVKELSVKILELYLQLGIRGSQCNEPVHQVYCDFFTITQHANFRTPYGS